MSSLSRAPLVAGLLAPLALLGMTGQPGVWVGHRLIGAGTADTWGHAWGYWWTAQTTAVGQLPFADAPINYPEAQAWWVIDLPVALLLSPVTHLLGAGAAYNLAFALHAGIGAAAIAALVTRRGGVPWVGAAAGILAATSPFVRGALASGVPEALAVLWVPLLVWLVDVGLSEGRRRHLVAAGALSAVLVLDGAYGAIAGALAGAAAVGAALLASRARLQVLARSTVVAIPAALTVVGLRWALVESHHPALDRTEAQQLVDIGEAWALRPLCGVDLMSWSVPAQLLPLVDAETAHLHIVYVGILLPALLLAAAWQHRKVRRPALVALAAAIVALGPALYVYGTPRTPAVLPGTWLWAVGATNYYRLAGLVPVVGLVGLASVRHKWMPIALMAIAAEWLVGAPLDVKVPTLASPAGEVEDWLASQPEEGAVLDLPLDHEGTAVRGPSPQKVFYLQTVHHRPIASALYSTNPITDNIRAIGTFDESIRRAWRQQSADSGPTPSREVRLPRHTEPLELAKLSRALRGLGYRYVVLDLDLVRPYQRKDALRWLTGWLGAPAVTSSDRQRIVWSLPGASAPR